MSNSSNSNSSGGIGLTGVVFIVFLVLKLTGNIDWSWWWVTSPLWIGIAAIVAFAILAAVGFGVGAMLDGNSKVPKRFDEINHKDGGWKR